MPHIRMMIIVGLALMTATSTTISAQEQKTTSAFEEIRRFPATEARQGVAVDEHHFYAVTNRTIGKYDKQTGRLVKKWQDAPGGPFIHLDSGVVLDGRLYCAHSNFPAVPMTSSIEIFDADTLTPIASHSFGIFAGSATWVDRHDGYWWVAFANYDGNGGVPGRGPSWTALMKFDAEWRWLGGYAYPSAVIEKFGSMSNSGGSWGEDGLLYITGHDHAEVYAMSIPDFGSELVLEKILPVTAEGQGIAWDRSEPGTLYTIIRSASTVVASKLK